MAGATLYGLAVLLVSTLVIAGGTWLIRRAWAVWRELKQVDDMIQKFVPKRDMRWPNENA